LHGASELHLRELTGGFKKRGDWEEGKEKSGKRKQKEKGAMK